MSLFVSPTLMVTARPRVASSWKKTPMDLHLVSQMHNDQASSPSCRIYYPSYESPDYDPVICGRFPRLFSSLITTSQWAPPRRRSGVGFAQLQVLGAQRPRRRSDWTGFGLGFRSFWSFWSFGSFTVRVWPVTLMNHGSLIVWFERLVHYG